MGRRIRITVPGEPGAKGSVRACVVGGSARTYKDAKTRKAMDRIQDAAVRAMDDAGANPLQGPVAVTLRAYRAKGRPASKVGKQRAEDGLVRPVTKPDVDNYSKAALDSMNGVCYRDDAQVVRLVVEKWYSERPRTEIEVEEWVP